jgi:hypothetical protein
MMEVMEEIEKIQVIIGPPRVWIGREATQYLEAIVVVARRDTSFPRISLPCI